MAMSEKGQFEVYKKKLQGLCEEHNLTYCFSKDGYPISMTVHTTGNMDGQMSMLEEAEDDGYRSPDAKLSFAYKDGFLVYRVSETFTINDALFNKLKNLFRNMHSLWLQYFFRHIMDSKVLTEKQMPTVDDGDENRDIVAEAFDDLKSEEEQLELFDGEVGDDADDGDAGEEDTEYEYDDPDEPGIPADEA